MLLLFAVFLYLAVFHSFTTNFCIWLCFALDFSKYCQIGEDLMTFHENKNDKGHAAMAPTY